MPLDEALGIAPHQGSSEELMRLGCLLSVMMPYEQASWLLKQWEGLSVSASTLWNWVQAKGKRAMEEIQEQLEMQAKGEAILPESLSELLSSLPLIIGADGVMVPFRPVAKTPKGKTQWREIKVAILARLGVHHNQRGEAVSKLLHLRLVAVLGTIDDFIPILELEAPRQSVKTASKVVWLSDGGRGFWRVYRTCFSAVAIPILDFFHAAGHLWRATNVLFEDTYSSQALAWFSRWRHQLRHGQHYRVLSDLIFLSNTGLFSGQSLKTLLQVQAYFQRHHRHIHYQRFHQQQLPLGSGMVESSCMWLIQQRFKGVCMRWSESGFNHLLLLRLAWTNQRFDSLFSLSSVAQEYSHTL